MSHAATKRVLFEKDVAAGTLPRVETNSAQRIMHSRNAAITSKTLVVRLWLLPDREMQDTRWQTRYSKRQLIARKNAVVSRHMQKQKTTRLEPMNIGRRNATTCGSYLPGRLL